jgi:hypothetical protein
MEAEKTMEQLFDSGEYVDELAQEIPAVRFATVEEVANASS